MSLNKRKCRAFADPGLRMQAGNGILHAEQIKYIIRTAIKIINHHKTLILYIYPRQKGTSVPCGWSFKARITMRHWNARKMVVSNGVPQPLNVWEIAGISLRDAPFTRFRMKDVYSVISGLIQTGSRRCLMFKMLSWDAAGTSASLCGKGRSSAAWPVCQLCPVA